MNYTGISNCVKPVISLRKINEMIVNTKKTSKFMLAKVRTKRLFIADKKKRRFPNDF
jgi:hypothetical protein